MLAMQIFRLYLKYKIDGTYVYLANVGISHTILSIWIFITMFKIKNHFPFIIELFVNSKLIIWFDDHSYYIYLVHGLFCMGNELNVYKTFNNIWVSTIIFILLTLGLSYVLRKISNLIIQKLNVEIDKKLS